MDQGEAYGVSYEMVPLEETWYDPKPILSLFPQILSASLKHVSTKKEENPHVYPWLMNKVVWSMVERCDIKSLVEASGVTSVYQTGKLPKVLHS